MKNSRTSQIAALVLLAISDILLSLAAFGPTWFRDGICNSTAVCYLLLVVMIGALIYYIAMSKEKKFSIIISAIAVGTELLVAFLRPDSVMGAPQHMNVHMRWELMRSVLHYYGIAYPLVFSGGLFLATTIIFIALLVTFIKKEPVAQRKELENWVKNKLIPVLVIIAIAVAILIGINGFGNSSYGGNTDTCTICGKSATHTFQGSGYCDNHYKDAINWALTHPKK